MPEYSDSHARIVRQSLQHRHLVALLHAHLLLDGVVRGDGRLVRRLQILRRQRRVEEPHQRLAHMHDLPNERIGVRSLDVKEIVAHRLGRALRCLAPLHLRLSAAAEDQSAASSSVILTRHNP
eukprot:5065288-Pleurochrysis_carterae.AAC.2